MQKIASKSTPSDKIHKKQQDKFVAFLLELANRMGEKFDYVISNPPYQIEGANGSNNAMPIYTDFIDAARMIGDHVCMIHPARFLSNAGQTKKAWNKSILSSEEFTVLAHFHNARDIFPSADIKGGVAITSFEKGKKDGGYKNGYVGYPTLWSIKDKVWKDNSEEGMEKHVSSRIPFRYKDKSLVGTTDIRPDAFTKAPALYSDKKVNGSVEIIGLDNKKRVVKYIERSKLQESPLIDAYKLLVPAANGSGALGEKLSTPFVGGPLMTCTDTFLAIGKFENKTEAEHLLKYVKTKFARVMLGILKTTQHNPNAKWKLVPWQDFTKKSDIDWSKSVKEIDQQLYNKYGLTKEEIKFIEDNVQEMK
jgi:type I restriction-modification system DNA methylase subunit